MENLKLEEIKKIENLIEQIKQRGCFIVMKKNLNENVKEDKYLCPEIDRLSSDDLIGHHICSTYFTTNTDGKPMIKLFLSSSTGVILDENDIEITAGASVDLFCKDACDTEIQKGTLNKALKRSQSVKKYEKENDVDKNDEFIYSNYDNKFHKNLIYFCKKNGQKTNQQIMTQLKDIFTKQYSNNVKTEKLEHNEFLVLPKDKHNKKISIKSTFINITDDPETSVEIKEKCHLDEANISESYKNFLLVLSNEGFKVIDKDKINSASAYTKIIDLCENIDDVQKRLSYQPIANSEKLTELNKNNESEKEFCIDDWL